MRRALFVVLVMTAATVGLAMPAAARDRPFGVADLIAMKWGPLPAERDADGAAGNTSTGGQFSVNQIEKFRCSSSGVPTASVDMSCNTTTYNQDWNPDNEIAVAVDPDEPEPRRWPARTTTSTGSTTPRARVRRSS